jgi:cytochrome c
MQNTPLIAIALAVGCVVAVPALAQDAAHGENLFKACAACHAKDDSKRAGPGLRGIVGRTAGKSSGFHYSRAMKQSNIVWDAKTLDAYIAAPQKVVPGNIMPYAGMKDAQDRADLIAYLESLK